MKVIIAEKPSVARDIAAIVGASNRREGYLEGIGYAVTWAFGHLIGLAMPQDYGITGFQAGNLPILPATLTAAAFAASFPLGRSMPQHRSRRVTLSPS